MDGFPRQPEPSGLAFAAMADRIYVVAGEVSGDTHGAGMIRALRELRPGVEWHGLGGPAMRTAGGGGIRDWVEDAAVMGLWEVLKRYGWFKERMAETIEEIKRLQPKVLVLIDYPGFNLRLADAIRTACPQTKIIDYISPQVWAWNKGRIPKMARILDEMLCLFPFEKPIFEQAGLKTTFVGHPLVDELEEERIHVPREENLVGLFPGSREREVARLFPMMLETAKRLGTDRPQLCFEAPGASPKLAATMQVMVAQAGMQDRILVTQGGSHALMQRATCAVIASGTATLEAAYFGLPYCLVYKIAWPTYVMARLLVKLKFIGLVNILADEKVVEEYIQDQAEPASVSHALAWFLDHPLEREKTTERMLATAAKLGGQGAHRRAAERVAAYV